MFGSTFLRGQASMLGEGGGGLNLFLSNQADNPLHLNFGEIILWGPDKIVHSTRYGPRALVCHLWSRDHCYSKRCWYMNKSSWSDGARGSELNAFSLPHKWKLRNEVKKCEKSFEFVNSRNESNWNTMLACFCLSQEANGATVFFTLWIQCASIRKS